MKLRGPHKAPPQDMSRKVKHFTLLPEDRVYEREEWERMRLCRDDSGNITYWTDGGCTVSAMPRLLDMARDNYDYDRDGHSLIAAFLRCYEEGLLPPPWILQGLYDGFAKWESLNLIGDSRTLDEVFATGSKPDWRERYYEKVHSALYFRYSELKYYWNIKDKEIFKILAISLEEEGITGPDNHITPVFTARMIEELHKSQQWSARYKEEKPHRDKHRPFLEKDSADRWMQMHPQKAQTLIRKHQKRDPTQDYTED